MGPGCALVVIIIIIIIIIITFIDEYIKSRNTSKHV